jgi:hypothetical protein
MLRRLAIGLACLSGAAASATDIQWGVNGHPITAYPGIPIAAQLDLVDDLGLSSYRVNVPDAGRADELDALVREARPRGIEILPVITPGGVDLDEDSAAVLYDKARALATALAARFRNDINVWELGNEMENYAILQPCEQRDDGTLYPCEWGPASGAGPLDYYGPRWAKVSAVLRGLSDGIRAADPELRTAIGTAGWGHVGAFERMRQDGIDWDITVWHMYGQDPQWAFEQIARFERPIWVTEFNHPYGSRSDEGMQADGLTQIMARLRELRDRFDVQAAHIYELLDEPYWAPSYEAEMGVVRLTEREEGGWAVGEPKPAYHAVRTFVRGDRIERDCDLADAAEAEPSAPRLVAYAECLMLGRDPTPGGEDWESLLVGGESGVTDMLLAMLRSDEFAGRYSALGLTDRDYVALLYRVLLDREADPHGLDSYAADLATGAMTRGGVALGLMNSSEFRTKHAAIFATSAATN